MPRRPRLAVADIPVHIVQRGVNRAAVFYDDDDRRRYLACLAHAVRDHEMAIHAYVLMTNHVHLLATGRVDGAVSSVMRRLGTRYVAAFNRKHGRTGTLWEGRFRSSLVDSDRYALAVCRYIELNPVRAGIVERPEYYRWSSVHANTGMRDDPLVAPIPSLAALSADRRTQQRIYRESLETGVAPEDLDAIRVHARQEGALGGETFRAQVARRLQRPVAPRPRGRPRREP